jgi:serine/threonine protein kinase
MVVQSHPEMPSDSRIGTDLAGYRILELLGRGGMSVVYLAEQAFPHRRVALKLLAPEISADERFRERFTRESNAAASIDHPNVIPIFGAGEVDGVLYIAMRYVEGTDLRTLLEREGPLDPARTVSIISQTAAALDAAHRHGLTHRDVKPGNILIASGGDADHVYLADFGLIKRRDQDLALTNTGQFMGSVDYVAPEQIEGNAVDPRVDVYSLGCVLFECLTGAKAFAKDNEAAVMFAHLRQDPPKPTATRPELPPAVDGVVGKALAKRPATGTRAPGSLPPQPGRRSLRSPPASLPKEGRAGNGSPRPSPGRWWWRRPWPSSW